MRAAGGSRSDYAALVVGSDGSRLGDLLAEVLYATLRAHGGSNTLLREAGF